MKAFLQSVLVVGALVAVSATGVAQESDMRCYTDSLGYTRCTYDNEQGYGRGTIRGYTDDLGYSRYRDSNGNTTRCYTDSLGYTRCSTR